MLAALLGQPGSAAWTRPQDAAAPVVGTEPGRAQASSQNGRITLFNDAVSGSWTISKGRFSVAGFEDKQDGRQLPLPASAFAIALDGGRIVQASEMRVAGTPRIERLAGDPHASRLSDRLAGRQVVVALEATDAGLRATWHGVLRDGSNYLRQVVTIEAAAKDVSIGEVRLIDVDLPDAHVVGTVKGSPIVSNEIFLGFEHP
ncbi:MAG TPA: hypothetical protein VGL62_06225, partial [Vicinamibacterales bacterium]